VRDRYVADHTQRGAGDAPGPKWEGCELPERSFSAESPLLLNPRAHLLRTNSGALLRDPATGDWRLLSQSQALALALCGGKHCLSDMIPAMAELYGVPCEPVAAELTDLLSDCLRRGIVVVLPAPIDEPLYDHREFVFVPDPSPDAIHPNKLSTVGLQLSAGCALSCIYCFASSKDGRGGFMPTPLALRLLDEGRQIGARFLLLGGGEPVSHPDISRILWRAVQLGYEDMQVSTKATCITRDLAIRLRQAGLDRIQVSLDSWHPDEVDFLAGRKGAFQDILSGLMHLLEQDFMVGIRPTLTRFNASSLPQLVRTLVPFGIRAFRPATMLAVGRGIRDLMPTAEQLADLERELQAVREETGVDVTLGASRAGVLSHCIGARTNIYVLAGGEVVPCDTIATLAGEAETFGNALTQTLPEIWEGERIRAFRRPRVKHPTCLACDMLLLCAGGCRVRALIFSGDMSEPDPRCCKIHPEHEVGAIIPV